MQITQLKMPFIYEGLTEFTINTLYNTHGDSFKIGDPLLEIETPDSFIEIPFDVNGTFVSWLVQEGDVIAPGTNLCEVEVIREYSQEEYRLFTENLRQLYGLDEDSDLDEIYAAIRKTYPNGDVSI